MRQHRVKADPPAKEVIGSERVMKVFLAGHTGMSGEHPHLPPFPQPPLRLRRGRLASRWATM